VKRLVSFLVASTLLAAACGSNSDAAFSVETITVTFGGDPVAASGVEGEQSTTTQAEGEGEGEEVTIPAVEVSRSSVDGQLEDIADADEFVDFVESTGGVVRSGEGLDSEYVAQYLSDRIVFEIIKSDFDHRGLELTDEDRAAGRAELEARLVPAPDPSLPPDQQGPTGAEVLEIMPASYRDFLIDSFARVGVLSEVLIEESAPTDEEVRAAYDADPAQFEQACGAHILIAANDDPAAGDVVTAEQAEGGAVLILSSLEDGADFAELAQERSDDPGSGAQGGDLGCAPRGAYVPEFEEALFGAEEGEIVGPVVTEFGSHVIRLDELLTDFEDVEETIRLQLAGQEDLFSAYIQQVLQAAEVTVDERYGTWSPEEGRVIPREGPTSATTTTLPILELPGELPVPDTAPTATAGG
jgi:hypothetical protein